MTSDSQDDKVLEQLYKQGAKESPPAKLNNEIINYAANPKKSAETSSPVGSHFGGGWKVPLSMAASVVVVFALLVQLDQSPQELELPPIPDLSVPTEQNKIESKDEALKNQPEERITTKGLHETKEADMDAHSSGALIIDKSSKSKTQTSTDSTQVKRKQDDDAEQKTLRDREQAQPALEKSERFDELESPSNATASKPVPPTSTAPAITTPKANKEFSPKPVKPQTTQKKLQEPGNGALNDNAAEVPTESVMQQRSINQESIDREGGQNNSDLAADTELGDTDAHAESQSEYAPIPVEDWLLMIERLVAQKDYAEAARQLEKFKQAHPKVNVEDLDAKIP